jgi:hypothetical protein
MAHACASFFDDIKRRKSGQFVRVSSFCSCVVKSGAVCQGGTLHCPGSGGLSHGGVGVLRPWGPMAPRQAATPLHRSEGLLAGVGANAQHVVGSMRGGAIPLVVSRTFFHGSRRGFYRAWDLLSCDCRIVLYAGSVANGGAQPCAPPSASMPHAGCAAAAPTVTRTPSGPAGGAASRNNCWVADSW